MSAVLFGFGLAVGLGGFWRSVPPLEPAPRGAFALWVLLVLAFAYSAGRGRRPRVTATATAVAVANSTAVAQGGSVHLHLDSAPWRQPRLPVQRSPRADLEAALLELHSDAESEELWATADDLEPMELVEGYRDGSL